MIIIYIIFSILLLFLFTVAIGAPYVPSRKRDFCQLLEQLNLNQEDVLVDAGSGDGKILRLVGPKIKRAIGYEINPVLVLISRLLNLRHSNLEVCLADFGRVNLPSDVSVIYLFSAGIYLHRFLKPIINHVRSADGPVIVVSYGFKLDEIKVKPQIIGAYCVYKLDRASLPNSLS